MKLRRKITFLILSLQVLLFSFSYKHSSLLAYDRDKLNSNNFPEIISDAIEPSCSDFLNNNNQINNIRISIPKSRKWQKNTLKALINPGRITDKFKRRYNAFIFYNNGEKVCKNKAKIRISGDLNPLTIPTTTGKKERYIEIIAFGKSPVNPRPPNATISIGASANMGIVWLVITHGITLKSVARLCTIARAKAMPSPVPKAKPAKVPERVIQA